MPGGQGEEGPGAQAAHDFHAVMQGLKGGVLHRLDAGSGQNIMEFREAQIPGGLQKLLGRIFDQPGHGRMTEHALGLVEHAFQRPMLLLDADLGGIAAHAPGI